MTLKTKTGMFDYLSSYFSDNTGDEASLLEFLKDSVDSYEDNLIDVVYIKRREDLPDAEDGVISLNSNKAYILTTDLDLQGDRIVFNSKAKLGGFSSETCRLSSLGLLSGENIVSSEHSIDIENITFNPDASTNALNVVNSNSTLFINNTSVVGEGNFGSIENVDFIIVNNATLENKGNGPSFTGTVETIAFTDCFFTNGVVEINLESSLTLTKRIRIRDSSFDVASGNVGINFSPQATVAVEGYALQFVNFSGSGTYLQGYDYLDDVSRFSECRGITNTSRLGQMILAGNTTSTTVDQVDTYYKVAGVTVEGGMNQRFSHTSSGRLSYISSLTQNFMASCTASLSAGSNEEIALAVFRNGSFIQGSEVTGTTGSGGRSEGLASQALVTLGINDYVEVFVKNSSSSADIVVEDFNFIIREI